MDLIFCLKVMRHVHTFVLLLESRLYSVLNHAYPVSKAQ